MLHTDEVVDQAMRINIAKGFHFFDPDTMRIFRSRMTTGVRSPRGRFAYLVERRGTVTTFRGTTVQTPHSRVVRVDLKTGETENLTETGKVLSEMINGCYVNNGEACHYKTNAQALKAAKRFAGVDP